MIVQLTGGLGNQLFQYAFGRGVAEKTGRQLAFCWERSSWDYVLDRYVDVPLVTQPSGPLYLERLMTFDEGVYHPAASHHYFSGYWQTERYFENMATHMRRIAEPFDDVIDGEWISFGEKLRAENSVFLHVRRGDYLKQANIKAHGILPLSYYETAMAIIRQQFPDSRFYAFSDDKEWCRNTFPGVVTLPTPDADSDLYLMRHCRHGIIANSSFGWWAGWLGPDSRGGTVIAPRNWFGPSNKHLDTSDLIPKRWLTV